MPEGTTQPRLVALDVSRGLAVGLMVFVERLPGDGYGAFRHAAWEGLTFADVVFPVFLFVLGASLAMALARPMPPARRAWQLARRAVLLLVVGLAYNAMSGEGFDLSGLRWPGVLQRIAVAGLLGALVVLALRRRVAAVAAAGIVVLVAYGLVLDHRTPSCAPEPTIAKPECSWPGQLDLKVFGSEHVYGQGAAGYDPEGLASTAGALGTVLLGWVAGEAVRRDRRWRTVGLLVAAGAALAGAATLWGMPVIKRLWTPTYALVTAAITAVALATVVALTDAADGRPERLRRATRRALWPVVALGRNALLLYVAQHAAGTALQKATAADGGSLEQRWVEAVGGSPLTFGLLAVLACVGIASFLHWRRWYATV